MTELVFYTNPMSRGRIARRMLEECVESGGLEYRTEVIAFGAEMKSEAYLRINPLGKVPAIVHAGKVVTETPAIICYLADAFPQAGLAPPLKERQDYYRWMFYAAGPLEAAVTNKALGVEIPPEKQGFVGYGTYDLAVETLVQGIAKQPWIAGDNFTAADVFVGSHVAYGLQYGMLPEHPVLRRYCERLATRPAWQRAEAIDNALMPKPATTKA